ncbi:hypothetical protein DD509_06875 [Dehalogenimonas alkenigignens]|nr:hypothetical protein DD509_06875 [Dehalogenimonas alkenigignens]
MVNLNPTGAISLVLTLIILSLPLIETEEQITDIKLQPYQYEQIMIREAQIRKFVFPWFTEVTQSQYLVRNADLEKGTFVLNFNFDNGSEARTITKREDILAGESRVVTVDSPLRGNSTVTLRVIPPNMAIPETVILKKQISAWQFLGRSAWDLIFSRR